MLHHSTQHNWLHLASPMGRYKRGHTPHAPACISPSALFHSLLSANGSQMAWHCMLSTEPVSSNYTFPSAKCKPEHPPWASTHCQNISAFLLGVRPDGAISASALLMLSTWPVTAACGPRLQGALPHQEQVQGQLTLGSTAQQCTWRLTGTSVFQAIPRHPLMKSRWAPYTLFLKRHCCF